MKPIKAIIADDEALLRSSLRSRLAEVWPELRICGEAENGRAALALVEKHQPQVVFLDIRMPGLSGMEVAVKIAGTCHVVFVTAYDQYAVEAFENEAVDYLLKPVENDRLAQTVSRLKKVLPGQPHPSAEWAAITRRLMEHLHPDDQRAYLQWIRVQQGDTVRLVPVTEVIYFQASDKYTLVMTSDKEFVIRKSIKALVGELDPAAFWQIHRGTIVKLASIEAVSRTVTGRGTLRLKDRSEILTVSRRYLAQFKHM